jgi:hypothetical protein
MSQKGMKIFQSKGKLPELKNIYWFKYLWKLYS